MRVIMVNQMNRMIPMNLGEGGMEKIHYMEEVVEEVVLIIITGITG